MRQLNKILLIPFLFLIGCFGNKYVKSVNTVWTFRATQPLMVHQIYAGHIYLITNNKDKVLFVWIVKIREHNLVKTLFNIKDEKDLIGKYFIYTPLQSHIGALSFLLTNARHRGLYRRPTKELLFLQAINSFANFDAPYFANYDIDIVTAAFAKVLDPVVFDFFKKAVFYKSKRSVNIGIKKIFLCERKCLSKYSAILYLKKGSEIKYIYFKLNNNPFKIIIKKKEKTPFYERKNVIFAQRLLPTVLIN